MAKDQRKMNTVDHQHRGPAPGGPSHGPGHGSMGMPGQKATHFSRSIKDLAAYCKRYLPFIIAALVLAFSGAALNVYGPNQLSKMTDIIQEGIMGTINLDAVRRIGLLLAVLYGIGLIFNYTQGFIMATVTQRITKRMRTDLSQKINRIPLAYFDNHSHGNVLSRVTNDIDTIGQTLNNSLGQLVTGVATFIGALVMMFYTNYIMALTGVASTLIGFVLMAVIMKHSQKYFVQQQTELGKINGHIEEMYGGHHIVKVYNGEQQAKDTFSGMNERLYKNAWKSQFMSGIMMPIMLFIGNFGYVAVSIVGAYLVTRGTITIGTIVAFMVYIRLFTQPLSQLAQAATNLQAAAASSERVFEFLAEEELEKEDHKKIEIKEVKGDVEFKHVAFGYDKDKLIIKDFSLQVKAGQKIAIVGPTGAGKSTLVNLLMRFYEVSSGEITIDGIPISQMTREQVHSLFCMVLQDTWLFEGTIRENIVYSKENVTDEEVIAACKAVGLHHTVKSLPKGYDTVLNNQVNLSAGQKQLVTIARAMIENAPLLILDEATSSVDTRTELQIQQAMDKLTVGKTSFVIAHRLSTIKNADLILVMKEGNILETGTHEELLAKSGFYAELYNSQFESAS